MNIQSIALEMTQQDTRSTAQPYLILLQTKKYYVTHPDYTGGGGGIKTIYQWDKDNEYEAESVEELKQVLLEAGAIDEHWLEENEGFTEFDCEVIAMDFYWETENVFFTESGYSEHVRQNKHNLGEFRSYGICAWRNPEMKIVMESIHRLADLEK
jgi:hypothetical protein